MFDKGRPYLPTLNLILNLTLTLGDWLRGRQGLRADQREGPAISAERGPPLKDEPALALSGGHVWTRPLPAPLHVRREVRVYT